MQSTMGQGLFDNIIKSTMSLVNDLSGGLYFKDDYLDSFSMMNMFSHKSLNLIASEALAEVISMGTNQIAGSMASRAISSTGRRVGRLSGTINQFVNYRVFGSIDNILKGTAKVPTTLLGKLASSRATRLVFKGLQEYSELVGEVIVEMAFDNMVSMDPNSRPLGGSETFMMAMTLSVITMGALSSLGTKGMKEIDGGYRLTRSGSSALRISLMALSTGLAISQLVMRLPVYMSVAK